MGRRSSITQLDPRVREAVDRLVREDRATIDDIVEAIEQLGGEASRAAVGRYVKNAREQMEDYRKAQELAKVWIGKLEDDPDSDVGRLLSEMLRTVAFQTIGGMHGDDEVNPTEVMMLARSLKDLASADKISAERELRVRKEERAKAAEAVAKIAKKGGMTADAADEIRRKILGVKT